MHLVKPCGKRGAFSRLDCHGGTASPRNDKRIDMPSNYKRKLRMRKK